MPFAILLGPAGALVVATRSCRPLRKDEANAMRFRPYAFWSAKTDQGCFYPCSTADKAWLAVTMLFYVAESPALAQLGKAGYWERSVSITGRWYETGMLYADLEK